MERIAKIVDIDDDFTVEIDEHGHSEQVVRFPGSGLLNSIDRKSLKAFEYLLKHTSDLNLCSVDCSYGSGKMVYTSPLMHAVAHDRKEVVNMLLEAGAEINNKKCENILHYCLKAHSNNHINIAMYYMKLFISHGADINKKSATNDTILYTAIKLHYSLKMIEFLIQSGATIDVSTYLAGITCSDGRVRKYFTQNLALASTNRLLELLKDTVTEPDDTATKTDDTSGDEISGDDISGDDISGDDISGYN